MIRNFSITLGEVADSTVNAVTAKQQSLDLLAKIVWCKNIALDHLLAEQGSACAIANTTCHTWRNSSGEIETQLHKMREKAHWPQ